MQFDPASRALSSTIKRSHSQYATHSLSHTSNISPPPPKRFRKAASSGEHFPFSSAHSTPKPFEMADRQPPRSSQPGPSSPKQSLSNARRGSLLKRSKKQTPPKNVLAGPYHNLVYIEQEHNKSSVPLKAIYKETPKGSLNNFHQTVTVNGNLPTFTSTEGVIMEGNLRIPVHR